ncbi:hypothetical protein KGY77_11155 [Candidatus Bipolaricaulota bacterium]|nr:hypothetical protein [Candidatus Bipolaricaulota bacterium]MBS3793185.1 hypothetical protein [Candidatus Bipolaricaulota bacterium]
MYVKLEEEGHYHYCEEHLEEMDKLDVLDKPGQLSDDTYSKPEGKEICDKCQELAEEGHCHPVYVVTGSFTD